RHQVHPIAKRGDEGEVSERIKCSQLMREQAPMDILNRRMSGGAKKAVDATDRFVDLALQLLIVGIVEPGGDQHLKQYDFALMAGFSLEEGFVGEEFFRDALRIIQPLERKNDLFAGVPARELGDI